METMYSIYGWTMFLTALALPQFLGLLVHFRIRRFPRLASLIGFILTTISTLYLLAAFFRPYMRTNENDCGTASGIIAIFILSLTAVQMPFSLFVQAFFYSHYRAKPINPSDLNW